MPYVPQAVSELKDFRAYVDSVAPEFKDADVPSMCLNVAFNTTEESVNLLKSKLGTVAHARLLATVNDAKAWFAAGDDRARGYMTQLMEEYLRIGRFGTNEHVVDDSRFET